MMILTMVYYNSCATSPYTVTHARDPPRWSSHPIPFVDKQLRNNIVYLKSSPRTIPWTSRAGRCGVFWTLRVGGYLPWSTPVVRETRTIAMRRFSTESTVRRSSHDTRVDEAAMQAKLKELRGLMASEQTVLDMATLNGGVHGCAIYRIRKKSCHRGGGYEQIMNIFRIPYT